MSLAQRMHFLQDVFGMITIALVSVIINHYINFETPCILIRPLEKTSLMIIKC